MIAAIWYLKYDHMFTSNQSDLLIELIELVCTHNISILDQFSLFTQYRFIYYINHFNQFMIFSNLIENFFIRILSFTCDTINVSLIGNLMSNYF